MAYEMELSGTSLKIADINIKQLIRGISFIYFVYQSKLDFFYFLNMTNWMRIQTESFYYHVSTSVVATRDALL